MTSFIIVRGRATFAGKYNLGPGPAFSMLCSSFPVKHHEVPIHRVQPLVARFDISGRVATEEVLKGSEVDDRLVVVDFGGIAVGIAGEIVPAVKIDMGFEIGLPCVFHRRLEGQ